MSRRVVSRRDFLKRSSAVAGALAAPLAFPAPARGAAAPNERVNLAMIGVGQRGTDVMRAFAAHDDARFVAVCDAFRERRQAAQSWLNERYGGSGVEAYEDLRELLARRDVDGVVICTPDHWHIPAAALAVRAGKDVYVEKPLSVCLDWARRFRQLAARYGAVFQYGTQQRSSAQFRRACELARNGYLGEVQRVEAWCPDVSDDWNDFSVPRYGSTVVETPPEGFNYDLWLGAAPAAPYTVDRCRREGSFHVYDYSIGFIAGWGAHTLDIVQWGLGTDETGPVEVEGRGEIPARGLFDTVSWWDVRCAYASGVELHFLCHRRARPIVMQYRERWSDHGTTFFGTEGWVSVDRGGIYASDPRLLEVRLKPGDVRLVRSPRQDRNFIDCIRTRATTVSPLEAAIRSDTISHLSDVAIRLGRPIRWDPAAEEPVGDEMAGRMLRRALRAPWRV